MLKRWDIGGYLEEGIEGRRGDREMEKRRGFSQYSIHGREGGGGEGGHTDTGKRRDSRMTVDHEEVSHVCSPGFQGSHALRGGGGGYTVGKTLRADRHRHRD